jgi:hypothetical protein
MFLYGNTNKNHNSIPHFPFITSELYVETFLLLQNYFLNDLAKISKKIVDENIFIGMFPVGNTN